MILPLVVIGNKLGLYPSELVVPDPTYQVVILELVPNKIGLKMQSVPIRIIHQVLVKKEMVVES
jgi:hypothetical protein